LDKIAKSNARPTQCSTQVFPHTKLQSVKRRWR